MCNEKFELAQQIRTAQTMWESSDSDTKSNQDQVRELDHRDALTWS